jgi:esterase/lipase superfamily enzyme
MPLRISSLSRDADAHVLSVLTLRTNRFREIHYFKEKQMLFVTNRIPKQSERSRRNRKWNFDLDNNTASPSVFFCRRGINDDHTEIMHEAFMQELKDDRAEHILFFLHGFHTSPNAAFEAVEQIQDIADADRGQEFVRVVPVIWPADAQAGVIKKYYTDRDAALDSRTAFSRALRFFIDWQRAQKNVEDRCFKPVSILAHSMGNRVLREALFHLADEHLRRGMPRIFRCVFLSAADIVNETLQRGRTGEHIQDSSARVIAYYAYDDLALRGSKVVNLDEAVSRRLGHTGPEDMNKVDKNVYALDCGAFNTDWDPPTGHSYYRREKDGSRPSPLLLHALEVMGMADLQVPRTDPTTREGRLTS